MIFASFENKRNTLHQHRYLEYVFSILRGMRTIFPIFIPRKDEKDQLHIASFSGFELHLLPGWYFSELCRRYRSLYRGFLRKYRSAGIKMSWNLSSDKSPGKK